MSMNFNGSKPAPAPEPEPKKNNNKLMAEIVIAVVIASIAATVIMGTVMETQNKMERVFSPSSAAPSISQSQHDDLEQKLYDKCKNLEDWYRSLDGLESTNYHCDKYAKGWAGLIN